MAAERLKSPWRAALRNCALVLLALLILDQIALRVLVKEDRIFGRRLAPYAPPIFAQADVEPAYVEFDEELGWRLASGGKVELDWSGGRLGRTSLQKRKSPESTRIVALGGALTLAPELEKEETYVALLDAAVAGREIVNLSTPLYGLDQILMRLRERALSLEPDEIWIAFEPGTALVGTTRYLPLARRTQPEGWFKPRLARTEGGELQRLAIPDDREAWLAGGERYREEFAPSELWASEFGFFEVPGWAESTLLTKWLATLEIEARLSRDERLVDPESEAFQTLVAIALEIDREVTSHGARLRFLLLPDREVTQRTEALGIPEYTAFGNELRSYGFEVHDLAVLMEEGGGSDSPELWTESGSWSAMTHQLASLVLEVLLTRTP